MTRNAGIFSSLFAILLAVLYDVFFYKTGLGINAPMFAAIALLGFFILSKKTEIFRNGWSWFMAIPVLVFAVSSALYVNEYSSYASPILGILSLLVFAMMLTVKTNGLEFYLSQLALPRHFDGLVSNWKGIYQDLFSWREGQAKRVVWGIVIAFPLLIVFATLMADADPIFAEWLKNLNIWEGIWRVFRTVVVALITAAFLYLLASDKNELTEKTIKVFKMNSLTVGVVLGLLNALFALFVYIQIKYFFGGADYVLANNLTYAEYARQGFFELMRVLGVAAILVIAVQRSFAHHGSHWSVNGLQVLFIAQVGLVAASALRRMALYQDMYGFTALRLYVEWFMYALVAVLVFSGISLVFRLSFRRFFHIVAASGLAVAAIVSLVNVDSIIAAENINRFLNEKKPLDARYLSSLSRDAAPSYASIVTAENFERLNISQKLLFDSIVKRFGRENASSTFFSYTYSEKKSADFLASLPETFSRSILLAQEKDKAYRRAMQNITELAPYANAPCIETFRGEQPSVDPDGKPVRDVNMTPKEPGNWDDIQCTDIANNGEILIQAQLIRTHTPIMAESRGSRYVKSSNISFSYRIAENARSANKNRILYSKDLAYNEENVFEEEVYRSFTLLKSGALIESDFPNRTMYVHPFLTEGGYKLGDKKLY